MYVVKLYLYRNDDQPHLSKQAASYGEAKIVAAKILHDTKCLGAIAKIVNGINKDDITCMVKESSHFVLRKLYPSVKKPEKPIHGNSKKR